MRFAADRGQGRFPLGGPVVGLAGAPHDQPPSHLSGCLVAVVAPAAISALRSRVPECPNETPCLRAVGLHDRFIDLDSPGPRVAPAEQRAVGGQAHGGTRPCRRCCRRRNDPSAREVTLYPVMAPCVGRHAIRVSATWRRPAPGKDHHGHQFYGRHEIKGAGANPLLRRIDQSTAPHASGPRKI